METAKLQKQASTMLDPKILMPAITSAFVKLDPRLMAKNPVMFVVEIVAALTTVIFVRDLLTGGASLGFTFQIILWLWFTVLFANFAEAVAEGRGKAQAESLRRTRTESVAHRLGAATGTSLDDELTLFAVASTTRSPGSTDNSPTSAVAATRCACTRSSRRSPPTVRASPCGFCARPPRISTTSSRPAPSPTRWSACCARCCGRDSPS